MEKNFQQIRKPYDLKGNIHPVSILVMLMAITAAFGVLGAFIATQLAAFIRACYEVFYLKELHPEKKNKHIDRMLYRK